MTVARIECPWCKERLAYVSISPEGLEAKPEQIQPIVQSQDAILDTDKPSVQPAGNPDGDVLEAFSRWTITMLAAHGNDRGAPEWVHDKYVLNALILIPGIITEYKRQGAA